MEQRDQIGRICETLISIRLAQVGGNRRGRLIALRSAEERNFVEAVCSCHFDRVEQMSAKYLARYRGEAGEILKECRAAGMSVISLLDSRYPPRLRELADPPGVLFCLGEVALLRGVAEERFGVAIVGTRRASEYGLRVSSKLAAETVNHGGVTVSGLALGVDGAAHQGAIEAVRALGGVESGAVAGIAVLGGGIGKLYPQRHRRLAEALIVEGGLVVSEYLPRASPVQSSFLERNRIIAGFSDVIVVVEAPRRSGALSTVSHGLEIGREVMVVPGRIDCELSTGSNELLKRGAGVLTEFKDIIDQNSALSLRSRKLSSAGGVGSGGGVVGGGDLERVFSAILAAGSIEFDSLLGVLRFSADRLRAELTQLELDGRIFVRPGGYYSCFEFVDTR